MADEDLLLLEQVQCETLVVDDPEALHVQLGEQVQGAVGLPAAHPVDRVELAVGQVALLLQPPTGQDEVVDGLVAAQGGLDRVLGRDVGAHAHVGQQLDALQIVPRLPQRPGDGQPPGPVPGHPVGLGQPGEGQAQHVVLGQHRGVDHLGAVVGDLLVDLIGEQHEFVLAGQVHDGLQGLAGVHRPGGVVGVDHDDALGARGDLGPQVLDVGVPPVGLVAQVVHRGAAGQGDGGRPQRVVRGGHEDLVPGIAEGLQGQGDHLRDPVAQEHLVRLQIQDALGLVVLHDGGARGVDAPRVRVALGVRQVPDHVHHHRVRGFEAERRGVADVQPQDPMPLGLHPLGLLQHRAADVVEDVMELVGLPELSHVIQRIPIRRRVRTRLSRCPPGPRTRRHPARRPHPARSSADPGTSGPRC
ncbi:Uncharacterised protein [Mycobacteroides abscessus subsp. abscessus]|nr:Uncharacterised protein [Mycobacteroides abscessus subsp. abscessus]